MTARVRARVVTPRPRPQPLEKSRAGAPGLRRVRVAGKWVRVPVLRREHLLRARRTGPALVLDYGATTLVPPGWNAVVDHAGNLVLRA